MLRQKFNAEENGRSQINLIQLIISIVTRGASYRRRGGTLSRASWSGEACGKSDGVGVARSPASCREGVPPRVCHLCLQFSSSSARSRFVSVCSLCDFRLIDACLVSATRVDTSSTSTVFPHLPLIQNAVTGSNSQNVRLYNVHIKSQRR